MYIDPTGMFTLAKRTSSHMSKSRLHNVSPCRRHHCVSLFLLSGRSGVSQLRGLRDFPIVLTLTLSRCPVSSAHLGDPCDLISPRITDPFRGRGRSKRWPELPSDREGRLKLIANGIFTRLRTRSDCRSLYYHHEILYRDLPQRRIKSMIKFGTEKKR